MNDPMIEGLVYRCREYLLTKKNTVRKDIKSGNVFISLEQLKFLVDQSSIKDRVYESKPKKG